MKREIINLIFFSRVAPIIFSEKALNVLKNILDETGQILPIITPSKRKRFYSFVPSKTLYDNSIINMNKSEIWTLEENRKTFFRIVLNQNAPKNKIIFSFKNDSLVVVNEDFKKIVEDNNLEGFSFSYKLKVIPE